ncbi:MAG TPA: hypothetical protein VJ808_03905, partial [Gemmatimonadales bacterium]|nr:hypothetical protein [Gemmatimonadales bacterium]
TGNPPPATQIAVADGEGQTAPAGSLLPLPLAVVVTGEGGVPIPGVAVTWSVIEGGGAVTPINPTTNAAGIASADFSLGPAEGPHRAQAEVSGVTGSPVIFSATATVQQPEVELRVLSGGNNVPDRWSSDLWVHGNYAYTGTWGFREAEGNVLNVWSLDAAGVPNLINSVAVDGISTVSDVEVSSDGQVVMFGSEIGDNGLHLYSLANPAAPTPLDHVLVDTGIHTATFGDIGGRRYAFAARNPGNPALLIYDVTDPANMVLTARVPVPDRYGIHDTFVRDGLAFVFVWDAGVIIYDVGNGIRGGSPARPVEVSRVVTARQGATSPAAHNGWWFHNPVSGERRYLFVGQEGPQIIGEQSRGDIHVLDVSDLTQPREVAFFHLNGAGTHNFWMDEQRQILYAAYYNGGVIALDVSGTLEGDLADRLVSRVRPGGPGNTYTWGVQLAANGFLYAIDMESGFWQLATE